MQHESFALLRSHLQQAVHSKYKYGFKVDAEYTAIFYAFAMQKRLNNAVELESGRKRKKDFRW